MGFAEHRLWYDGWCPQPLVAAAAVAGATERLRVGTAMLLLPQHDPHRIAAAARDLAVSAAAGSTWGSGSATATPSTTGSGWNAGVEAG